MKSIAVLFAITVTLVGCGDDEQLFHDAGLDASSGDAAAACAGLELGDCRRAIGCAADLCEGCVCGMTYRGCLVVGQVPAACPVLGCPSAECCHDSSDCNAGSCVNPDEQTCGGACNPEPGTCQNDHDCQAPPAGVAGVQVCDPIPCSCNGGARHCVSGCVTTDDCSEGQTCTPATGRCTASVCSAAAPCPLDFDCVVGGCQRRTCVDDLACDRFCVEGACREGLGVCQLPPP